MIENIRAVSNDLNGYYSEAFRTATRNVVEETTKPLPDRYIIPVKQGTTGNKAGENAREAQQEEQSREAAARTDQYTQGEEWIGNGVMSELSGAIHTYFDKHNWVIPKRVEPKAEKEKTQEAKAEAAASADRAEETQGTEAAQKAETADSAGRENVTNGTAAAVAQTAGQTQDTGSSSRTDKVSGPAARPASLSGKNGRTQKQILETRNNERVAMYDKTLMFREPRSIISLLA